MLIGLLQVELHIPQSGSLKSKRFVLKSLKTRLRNKFNVSVAEVDGEDQWQRSVLGLAMVGNERRFLEGASSQILNYIEREAEAELCDSRFEIL